MIAKEVIRAHADSLDGFSNQWRNADSEGADEVVWLLRRTARLMRKIGGFEEPGDDSVMMPPARLAAEAENAEPIEHRAEVRGD